MLVKFEQNRMVQTTQNFDLFDKKAGFKKKHFWQSVDAILEDVSVAETFLFNSKLYWRLPSFSVQKNMIVWHV